MLSYGYPCETATAPSNLFETSTEPKINRQERMNKTYFRKVVAIGRSVERMLKIYSAETNLRHKLKEIYSYNPAIKAAKLDKKQVSEIRSYWKSFNIKYSLLWHQAYIAVNETMDNRYIPETIFYTKLEPWFNRMELCLAYEDKNMYHKLFPDTKMPEIILRNINGMYFNGLYEKLERPELFKLLKLYNGTYIIKPSLDSGGGKRVLAIRLSDSGLFIKDKPISFDELEQMFVKDFLIDANWTNMIFFSEFIPTH